MTIIFQSVKKMILEDITAQGKEAGLFSFEQVYMSVVCIVVYRNHTP